ncbi:MAG: adenine phosphoribosyltransferase [Pikeienuella sp.]
MNRNEFHKLFKSPGPVVLPVIHVLDTPRTLRNVEILLEAGAPGCFLINHDFAPDQFQPIIRETRDAFPSLWLAINYLAVTGKYAFPMLAELQAEGCQVDAYWADDACIDEDGENLEAKAIAEARANSGWSGLYFGGTAFKKQRHVSPDRYADAAREACPFMDVVTTSGVATGQQADIGKIETFRAAIGDKPMALASGVSPENAVDYADVDCFMVATGISKPGEFYDIDPVLLAELMAITRQIGKGNP